MKSDCVVRQCMNTSMEVKPLVAGRCFMKSMEMEFHSFSGIGSCLSLPYGLWHSALVCAQFIHKLMYAFTIHPKPGQWKFHLMSSTVFCLPKVSYHRMVVVVADDLEAEILVVWDV